MPTVRAVAISEHEEEAETRSTVDDENHLLLALKVDPDRSIGDIARACSWTLQNGEPHKSNVHRLLARMEKSKPKLVAKVRGDRWKLTDAGRAQAEEAERRFRQGFSGGHRARAGAQGRPQLTHHITVLPDVQGNCLWNGLQRTDRFVPPFHPPLEQLERYTQEIPAAQAKVPVPGTPRRSTASRLSFSVPRSSSQRCEVRCRVDGHRFECCANVAKELSRQLRRMAWRCGAVERRTAFLARAPRLSHFPGEHG
jgi:hypothetical protein